MLIPATGKARDDERHLGQAAPLQVVEVIAFAAQSALVVRPSLPENEDVVRVAVGYAVPADVVDLPTDARRLEQVEDDRVVEYAIPPDAVGGDPAGGAGGQVEAIGPGWTQDRAEVVRTQRRGLEQAVVERKVGCGVVAQGVDTVGGVKAVHRAAIILGVRCEPGMADVRSREAREVIRRHEAARAVGLRVVGRHAKSACERRVAIVMVERAILLHVDDDVPNRRAGPCRLRFGRG